MGKTYQVGQAIDLALGAHHDVTVETLPLPAPPLKKGDKGDRVKQLQTALERIKFLSAANGSFDDVTQRALGKFQHLWQVPAQGVYDSATRAALQKALAGEKPGGDAHKPPPHKPPPPHHPPPNHDGTVRGKIIANARWGIANEPRIHYAETRPIPALNSPHHLPLTTDCSGFATLCYKWAGAPDPNGNGYDGQGYTGTMLGHMHHIPHGAVEPGDLVVFGAAPGNHVCIALNKGGSLLASHGSESGPGEISFSDEHAWQSRYGAGGAPGEVTWLSVLRATAAAADHQPAAHAAEHKPAEHKPAEHKTTPAPHKPPAHKKK